MNIFKDLFLLQRLDHLIRTRATGCPARLATRLEASERTVYRLVTHMRDAGLPIAYDKAEETYYYTEPVQIQVEIQVNGDSLVRIKGGLQKSLDFFGPLPIFGSGSPDLCNAFQPMRAGWGAGVASYPV